MKKLNILIIPSWYPNEKDPLWGNYFIRQAKALNDYANVSMLHINRVGIKEINKLFKTKKTDGYDDKIYDFKFYKTSILNLKSLSVDYSFELYAKAAYKAYKKFILKIGKPDIILVESILPAGIAAKYISKKENIPYIIHEHSEDIMKNELYKKYTKEIINDADNYMAVNGNMKKNIIDLGRKNCNIIPNFIDCNRYSLKPKKDSKYFTLLNMSNFYKVKAVDVLLKALDIVINKYNVKDIRLKIVGTGEFKDYYMNISNELKLNKYVDFMGYIHNDLIPDIISNTDVLCVTSTFETFCIPIIESLASGRPVISTKCNGPMEIVNKDNGILVEINDVEEYAKAIVNMKKNYNKYNKKDIREYAISNYDKSSVCKKIIKICEDTINGD